MTLIKKSDSIGSTNIMVLNDPFSLVKVMEELKNSKEANEILKDGGVVIYYAEWCPHCQSKKPLWDKLSKELTKKGVVSGKLESKKSTNDDISGFPTYKVGPSKLEKSSSAETPGEVSTLVKDLIGQGFGGRRSRRTIKRRRKLHRTLRRNVTFR